MKLLASHAVDVSVQFVNANGNPADVDGAADWLSSNPAVATVVANAENSMLATITAGPSAGEAVITAVADSDLGEGMTEVEATISVTVIAKGVAIGGEISPVVVSGPGGPGVDNTLPGGSGGSIDNSLPHGQRPVDPGFGAGHPAPDRPDAGLPGGADTNTGPDNTLPEHAAPKG